MEQVDKLNLGRSRNKTTGFGAYIAEEDVFQRMLALERRRSERTAIPFALILFYVEDLSKVVSVPAIENLAVALGSAMRETDVSLGGGRVLHVYDTGPAEAGSAGARDARLPVFWLHGTPQIGAPPAPRSTRS